MDFKVNRNLWHYKMNTFWCDCPSDYSRWEYRHSSFCSYWRATVFNFLLYFIILSSLIIIAGAFCYSFYVAPIETLIVMLIALVVLGLIVSYVFVITYLEDRKYNKKINSPPSLLSLKIQAYKAKICPKVEYYD
jgi:hypothetical protein